MNNLFTFATKELSQDAMFCWIINWMRESEKNSTYYLMGKSLLELFLGNKGLDDYSNLKVYRQYKKIDVLITFTAGDEKYGLIIEDKTNTSEHSNQLSRYFENVRDDKELGIPDDNIRIAYVKTGIHYDEDSRIRNGITFTEGGIERKVSAEVIDLEQLIDTLEPFVNQLDSDILLDYVAFLNVEKCKRGMIQSSVNELDFLNYVETEDYDDGKAMLGTYYGQYCVLDTFFPERTDRTINISNVLNEEKLEYVDSIYAGTNNSGAPWTQYCFWGKAYKERENRKNDIKKKECHYLFWRVDEYSDFRKNKDNKPKYYISLRHYDEQANSKTDDEANSRKKSVYNILRDEAMKIRSEDPYRDIIKDISGSNKVREYKESDLIYIKFDDLESFESIDKIREFLSAIQNRMYEFAEKLDC